MALTTLAAITGVFATTQFAKADTVSDVSQVELVLQQMQMLLVRVHLILKQYLVKASLHLRRVQSIAKQVPLLPIVRLPVLKVQIVNRLTQMILLKILRLIQLKVRCLLSQIK